LIVGVLQFLRVENLALMDAAELDLAPGFTVVTGETGAGKSVLLGALSLLSGNRADKSVIRQGAECCRVEAILQMADAAKINALLKSLGLPSCEEGQLILRREIHRRKAARVQVNGSLATLAALQELGESWIDFHGPGEPQKLFRERHQLEMLDRYAGHATELDAFATAYGNWRATLAQARRLREGERLSADEADFIRSQLTAIDAVEVEATSIDQLELEFTRLDQAEELTTLAHRLNEGLAGDEGASTRLAQLVNLAQDLAEIDPSANDLRMRLEAAIIELDDLAAEFSQISDAVHFEAEEAEALRERMQQWLSIKRKYGPEVGDVLAKRKQLADRLGSQEDVEGQLEQLAAEAASQEKALKAQAAILRKTRLKAARQLAARVRDLLQRLGFKKAAFDIEILAEDTLKAHGDSTCQYRFAPNAGQPLLPLNKIASSGETARVMLALKAVLAAADATPLLVFDEVDANVGGEIGAEVGRELATLAGRHQVFCVTHLPQVAAYGQQHFLVDKHQEEASTTIRIRPIHEQHDERETELARMLGDRKSASARSHARELLATAKP